MIATFILAHLFLAPTDENVPEALTGPLTVSFLVAWVVATAVDTRVGGSGIGAGGIGDERYCPTLLPLPIGNGAIERRLTRS